MKVFWHLLVLTKLYYFHIHNVIALQEHTKGIKQTTVIYGQPTNYGEAAYFVSVKEKLMFPEEDREYDNYCSGCIIKPDLVVSAAHCFVDRYTEIDRNVQNFQNRIIDRTIVKHGYVVAGQVRSSSERVEDDRPFFIPQWRSIKDVIVPKDYHFPANDLALVTLSKEFYYNSNIQPISYAKEFKDYNGLKCFVTGFGKTSDVYKDFTPILMKSYVEVLNDSYCKKMIRYLEEKTMLCSSNKHTNALEGNSGGPLVCKQSIDPVERSRGVLVGIMSIYTYTNATIYTRISAFYRYIESGGTDKANKIKLSVVNLLIAKLVHCIV